MLEIRNLTVKAENKIILDKFNLKIKDGEIHVLMGPNGVGKSTLTKVIMNDPNFKIISGDILYNNESIIKYSTYERAKMGFFLAYQNPYEIDGVTNSDFLRAALSSIKGEKVNLYSFIKEIDKAVSDLNMPKSMIHRSINKGFSGGEKKKNEILQMKILKPKVVMLDEIDSGVDVDSLKILGEQIKSYHKENNPIILMITHYTHVLKYVKPDYVHVIKDGKIVKTGDYKLAIEIENNGFDFDEIMSNVNAGSAKDE